MTEAEICNYIINSPFIEQDEWMRILQNEEHDIMVDYGEEVEEPWKSMRSLQSS